MRIQPAALPSIAPVEAPMKMVNGAQQATWPARLLPSPKLKPVIPKAAVGGRDLD